MNQHSLLPPSSAARRVACYGSRAMEASMPSEIEPSPAGLEGEAAHAVAAAFLKLDNPDFNTYVITEEMMEGAHLYSNHVMAITGGVLPIIEQTISISSIHPEAFGTPDAWWYDESENHLYVWDYKFGHGFVEVLENWQLIAYAAGIFQTLNLHKNIESETRVTFVIVQPRSYHPDGTIRTWTTDFLKLCGYWQVLRVTEEYAMRGNAPLTPSPQCTHCKARSICPALQTAALTVTDVSMDSTPHNLIPDQIGNELRYLHKSAELLKARITGLEEQATHALKHGKRIPGYTLAQSPGRQVWTRDPEVVEDLGLMYGIDLKKPTAVITPAQAIKAKIPEKVVNAWSCRQPGTFKLVPQIDGKKLFNERMK